MSDTNGDYSFLSKAQNDYTEQEKEQLQALINSLESDSTEADFEHPEQTDGGQPLFISLDEDGLRANINNFTTLSWTENIISRGPHGFNWVRIHNSNPPGNGTARVLGSIGNGSATGTIVQHTKLSDTVHIKLIAVPRRYPIRPPVHGGGVGPVQRPNVVAVFYDRHSKITGVFSGWAWLQSAAKLQGPFRFQIGSTIYPPWGSAQ